MRPWELCVDDVVQLVEFAARIREYRKRVAKNKARLRKVRSRKKLAAAVKNKHPAAISKFKEIRKSAAKRAQKRRESMKASRKKSI